MCTVVTRWTGHGRAVELLAVRDELDTRTFDEPASWWPARPGVVGGRDRAAGGSWCVTDVQRGVTALVLNRPERRTGTPSRGVLPLLATGRGPEWIRDVDVDTMAAFTLVLAGPAGVTTWTWDTSALRQADLSPGVHVITSHGVDPRDPKDHRFGSRLRAGDWRPLLAEQRPTDDLDALVVQHPVEGHGNYATVFGQVITARPGSLRIESSRTPWLPGTWTSRRWPVGARAYSSALPASRSASTAS